MVKMKIRINKRYYFQFSSIPTEKKEIKAEYFGYLIKTPRPIPHIKKEEIKCRYIVTYWCSELMKSTEGTIGRHDKTTYNRNIFSKKEFPLHCVKRITYQKFRQLYALFGDKNALQNK